MQRDEADFRAARPDLFEHFRREMQSRRRRGDGAGGLRKNGLVALAVAGQFAVAFDVRRQRQFAEIVEFREKIFRA